MTSRRREPGSFRDPSGFVFTEDGTLYRQVNACYGDTYDLLMRSGLYEALVAADLLVSHEEVSGGVGTDPAACRILKPDRIPFVSYPYEWCFGQLKQAALATLATQQKALEFGMTLKDASAYNIQFLKGRPILIDTLSFDRCEEGTPWIAYGQFCRHFLAPLALMAYRDIRLAELLRTNIDGLPLDLVSALLPARTRFKWGPLLHLHLHARSLRHYGESKPVKKAKVSQLSVLGMLDSLRTTVERLKYEPSGTEWADYYDKTNYSDRAFAHKAQLVGAWLKNMEPRVAWDLGANTGTFSRLAAGAGALTISFDIDPAAVERNFRDMQESGEESLLPLVLDLANPSPALGWENSERASWRGRGEPDVVLALALVHHLCITNNVPVARLAEFFAGLGRSLIIEFVPKTDSQVVRMLANREDVFADYTLPNFEEQFSRHFQVAEKTQVEGADRFLFLMTRH